MSTGKTGRCPVSLFYIRFCLVSTADICPVAAADICPVSTADICPVSTEDICPVKIKDIWLLWGQLGSDENDFDPFFTPKIRKMEHARHCRRSRQEPRKRRHRPRRRASIHTRRGPGLREFRNKLPQINVDDIA